ncbi:MAG: hypothetical protein RRY12_05120 [Cloacibacillus sp.]
MAVNKMEKKLKKIKICQSVYGNDLCTMDESSLMDVDLHALENFYMEKGEKHQKSLSKFMNFWEQDGYEKLFNPSARILSFTKDEAINIFGKGFMEVNESVDRIVMSVWTIGGTLEQSGSALMSTTGSLMTGYLLDVTGSIALYEMHAMLIEWIQSKIALPANRYINGEFYPGMGSMRQDLMEKVVSVGDTERLIGVSASGNSLLRPRKSQCSFLSLGSAENAVLVREEPCHPCSGKKCLYYQLGGCHMLESKKGLPDNLISSER